MGAVVSAADRQVAVHLNAEELQLLMDVLQVDAWRMDDAAGDAAQAGETGRVNEARSKAAGSRALRVKLQHYHGKALAKAIRLADPPLGRWR